MLDDPAFAHRSQSVRRLGVRISRVLLAKVMGGRRTILGGLLAGASLTACAAPSAPSGVPVTVAPARAPASELLARPDPCHTIQPQWSLRRRVVHLAGCEWTAFGRQSLLLERGWPEAQVEFGPDEDALSVWTRVGGYWDVADPGHAREVRALAAQAPERELWPAWRRPWSAAFISWVMNRSGSPDFKSDAAHSDYLRAALERRPDSVVDIAGYAPVAGDLICAGRGTGPQDAAEFLRRLQEERDFFPSHCDIVAEVRLSAVVLIGGNVKNAVVATETPLTDGRIPPTTARPWAVALKLNEPPDLCATLSPGPGC